MAGTAAGALKGAKTKALGAGLRLRKGKKRKKGTTRKTTTASCVSFGKFKAVKDKKGGKKRKHKKSTMTDQQLREAGLDTIRAGGTAQPRPGAEPDPMLFECDDETTRTIEGLAHEYKAATREYSKAGKQVEQIRESLIKAVKTSEAKPSLKDGSYRIRAGDSRVTVSPSEKTNVKVVLDEDATNE